MNNRPFAVSSCPGCQRHVTLLGALCDGCYARARAHAIQASAAEQPAEAQRRQSGTHPLAWVAMAVILVILVATYLQARYDLGLRNAVSTEAS